MKVAFLDRDGTINKDYPDKIWSDIKNPEILSGSIEGLIYLRDLGYKFIIITNQYIINEGYISLKDYKEFNRKLINILRNNNIEIMDVFYCPHIKKENCNCFKPRPGMIYNALNKYPNIDIDSSIFIGDSLVDKELAEIFNMNFYGVNIDCKNKIRNILEIKKYIR